MPGLLVKAAAHFHRAERVGQDETPEQQAAAVAAAAASAKAANGKRADGSAVAAVDVVAKEKDEQRRKEYEHALKCVRLSATVFFLPYFFLNFRHYVARLVVGAIVVSVLSNLVCFEGLCICGGIYDCFSSVARTP